MILVAMFICSPISGVFAFMASIISLTTAIALGAP
jgi:Urea transporter/Ankyrin repeats (3 copies)